ncbi:MAG: hypothetical protein HY788_00565 [Deltaproteobacteria bacterium]|nr:hypothetical protein [Deltaproteobacteria bacterium]
MALHVEFSFDEKTYRHFTNGFLTVMHCHHYMTLLSKLAIDFDDFGGVRILRESVEDSVRPMIDDYCAKNHIVSFEDRLEVGGAYYSVMGMGLMHAGGSKEGGEVTLTRSHVDQGWIKKWGRNDGPVNFWTQGYISAMFASASNKPPRSYEVIENSSMVVGDKSSQFSVRLK